MLFTDAFVLLHLPKTGGTFVRAMLERAFAARRAGRRPWERARDLLLGHRWRLIESLELKHGGVHDIPRSHQGKPVVGCVRNPFDRLVSQYEFRWWARHPEGIAPLEDLRRACPRFPELSFEEWYGMHDRFTLTRYLAGHAAGEGPGLQSRQLLDFYARDPELALSAARSGRGDLAASALAQVRYLRTERLNRELYDLLVEVGFEQRWLSGLLEERPIHPPEGGRSEEQRWQSYYRPQFLEYVCRREALALHLFPEYDPLRGSPAGGHLQPAGHAPSSR